MYILSSSIKQDGGAIQFITPFSINQLQEINLLREIK